MQLEITESTSNKILLRGECMLIPSSEIDNKSNVLIQRKRTCDKSNELFQIISDKSNVLLLKLDNKSDVLLQIIGDKSNVLLLKLDYKFDLLLIRTRK